MTIGPGKYDDLCTEMRTRLGIDDATGGCVVLIVFGGNKGDGFSVQADSVHTMLLPDILEDIARKIRADANKLKS